MKTNSVLKVYLVDRLDRVSHKYSLLINSSATPTDVVVLKCRKICPTGNRRNLVLFTLKRNFRTLSNCRYCTDHAQNRSGPATNICLTLFQISSKSVHFRRSIAKLVKAVLLPHAVFCNIRLKYIIIMVDLVLGKN